MARGVEADRLEEARTGFRGRGGAVPERAPVGRRAVSPYERGSSACDSAEALAEELGAEDGGQPTLSPA